jgi:hypothetical protein
VAKEITVTEDHCPACLALLGIEDGTLRLHLLEHGLYQQKKIQTVEANPGWQLGRYFENQTGRQHRQDVEVSPVANTPADLDPEPIDPLLAAKTKEASLKDLAIRGITTNPITD